MKKHGLILFLLVLHFSPWSQKSITIVGRCTDAMAMQAKGRWMKHPTVFDRGATPSAEVIKHIDELHHIMYNIYPKPAGVDAVWHRSVGPSYFGAKRKYYLNRDNVSTFEYLEKPHFAQYYYSCLFFAYRCDAYDQNKMWPGYPGETGTHINITANTIEGSGGAGGGPDDTWTINGLPVGMRSPVLKTIRGFELQYPEPGSSARYVLVHRKGVLPYIPVTRKQYLDYCIIYHTKLYDEMIHLQEQFPVRTPEEQEKEKKTKLAKFEKDFGSDPKRVKSAVDYYLSSYQTDQQRKDEQKEKMIKIKNAELKRFTDELEKTTKEGLLDSPAVVLVKYHSSPIFENDTLRGHMLVTENPGYIRKELPKHVPQVFVVSWRCQDWKPQREIDRLIEQDFPFEQLEAMIDK